jgi:hypothetical protein
MPAAIFELYFWQYMIIYIRMIRENSCMGGNYGIPVAFDSHSCHRRGGFAFGDFFVQKTD